ncbi:MAG: hypothetical protein MI919_24005, partial [Holophagales bacterium]|nr:hypothetical protein [Holophagales bacterium]
MSSEGHREAGAGDGQRAGIRWQVTRLFLAAAFALAVAFFLLAALHRARIPWFPSQAPTEHSGNPGSEQVGAETAEGQPPRPAGAAVSRDAIASAGPVDSGTVEPGAAGLGRAGIAAARSEPSSAGREALEAARKARIAQDFATAESLLEQGLQNVDGSGDIATEARLRMERVVLLGTLGRGEEALEAAQGAVAVLRRAPGTEPELRRLEGQAQVRLAEVWNLLGRAAEAEAALERAARIYEGLGERRRLASVTMRRSMFANHRGDYARSLELGLRALDELEGGSALTALSNVAYA